MVRLPVFICVEKETVAANAHYCWHIVEYAGYGEIRAGSNYSRCVMKPRDKF